MRDATGRGGGLVLAGLVTACGPTIDLDGRSESDGPSTSESATSASTGHGTVGGTSGGQTTSTSGDEVDSTGVPQPKLDVSPPSDVGGVPEVPLYEACWDAAMCERGLTCVRMAIGTDVRHSICTVPCFDPKLDCPAAPEGWATTCALDLESGRGQYCAIACGDGLSCPLGYECYQLFLPDGSLQQTCLP